MKPPMWTCIASNVYIKILLKYPQCGRSQKCPYHQVAHILENQQESKIMENVMINVCTEGSFTQVRHKYDIILQLHVLYTPDHIQEVKRGMICVRP